jgi:hypothetical protein
MWKYPVRKIAFAIGVIIFGTILFTLTIGIVLWAFSFNMFQQS